MHNSFQGWSKLNLNSVACPLDCYDTCEAVYEDGKCKPNKKHPTTGSKLCVNFGHLLNEKVLEHPFFNNKPLELDNALSMLVEKLQSSEAQNVLYYKGSGNLGVMQSAPKAFFASYGATLTRGSLCDGGGGEGLEQGRGKVVNPPIENLLNADVIICWGRNFSVTSSHMYELVKDKTFITIDPIKTDIAKKSALHLQINPKTDDELALLLTRFAYMNDLEDEASFEEYASGADWFFDLAKSRPVVSYEATTGVTLKEVTTFMEMIHNKKVAIMVGLGVQKYYEGATIMRCIDSFAAYIGVHNKEAGGLWYLSDSMYGYEKQFLATPKKRVDIPSVNFADYEVVFIQGANPVISAPNTQRVIEGLKKSFVVYFGTTFNDTCEYADLIIPSTMFLEKEDVRISYGHEYKAVSNKVREKTTQSITEYELAQYLCNAFNLPALKEEQSVLEYYKNTIPERSHVIESFEFVEEADIVHLYEEKEEDEYYLITAKTKKCLNSQFKTDDNVYINSNCGINEGVEVTISSSYGQATFILKHSDDVKENCVLIYAGAKNVNHLTPHKSDESSFSAMFQEVLVTVELS